MSASSPPPQRLTIRSKILLGFGIVLAMLGVIATISVRSTRGFIKTAELVAHTHEVLELEQRVLRHVMEMESTRRGFVLYGEDHFLADHSAARNEVIEGFNALRVLSADSPAQIARLDLLKELLQRSFALQEAQIDIRRKPGFRAGSTPLNHHAMVELTRKIQDALREFESAGRELLRQRSELAKDIARATMITLIIGGTVTFFALVTACAMILRDVAARRRAEEALAEERNLFFSVINALPNYVFVKDAEGRYLLGNTAHRRYLGLDEEHMIEGRTVDDFFEPSVAAKFARDDRTVIEGGEGVLNRHEPVIFHRADGREIWLETTKVPLRDTEGRIIGLVGISSDISERREAEEKLKRFAGQLERSNLELQNFASVASHDLQEPLRKIRAFGDRLKAKFGDKLGEQGRDYLGRMQNAAERMQTLIQDLLTLSRVTSRARPFEQCDLREIVQAVLSDLEVAVEQSGARVEVGPLPVIDADPPQMRQLFQNLIANALKFHKPGEPPEVIISGREFDVHEDLISGAAPGERVCQIHIRDNGIGFDEKFAEQIFVVFQRLHTRQEYEGTGIGLAVCRKITDRHGGAIVAKSAEGQGAAFIITLPVRQTQIPSP